MVLQSMSSGGSTSVGVWLKTALLPFCNRESSKQRKLPHVILSLEAATTNSEKPMKSCSLNIRYAMFVSKTFPSDPTDWISLLLSSLAAMLCSVLPVTAFRP